MLSALLLQQKRGMLVELNVSRIAGLDAFYDTLRDG